MSSAIQTIGDSARRGASHVAGLAPRAELARHVLQDDHVREAAREARDHAVKIRHDIAGTDGVLSRLARDEDLQDEITAFVRSVTAALDAGTSAVRRRARRRVFLFALAGAGVAAALAWLASLSSRASAMSAIPVAPQPSAQDGGVVVDVD